MSKITASINRPYAKTRLIAIAILVFILVSGSVDFIYIRSEIYNGYTKQTKYVLSNELNLYQQGYSSAVSGFFSNALTTIENLASSQDILTDFESKNSSGLSTIFEHQENYDQQFDTISAFLPNGDLLASSTDATKTSTVANISGASLVLQKAVNQRSPAITNIFLSRADRYVISFVAPVYGPTGETYEGALLGNTTIASLSSRVNFLSSYKYISTVVTDSNGNIITKDNQPAIKLVNIANSEPLIRKAQNSNNAQQAYETNFLGQKVLGESTQISYGKAGKIYIISFIPQSYIDSNITRSQSGIVQSLEIFGVLQLCLLIALLVIFILTRWQKAASDDIVA
jgi:hypothetical protein